MGRWAVKAKAAHEARQVAAPVVPPVRVAAPVAELPAEPVVSAEPVVPVTESLPPPTSAPLQAEPEAPQEDLVAALDLARGNLDDRQDRVATLRSVGDFRRMTSEQSQELQDAGDELKAAEKDYGTIMDELQRRRKLDTVPREVVEPPVDRQPAPMFSARQDPEHAMEKVRTVETGERSLERGAMGVWDSFPHTGTVAETGEEYTRSRRREGVRRALGEFLTSQATGGLPMAQALSAKMRESPTLRAGMAKKEPEPTIAGGIAMAPYAPEGTDIKGARQNVHDRMTELKGYAQRYRKDIPRIRAELDAMERGPTGRSKQQDYANKQAEHQSLTDEQEKVKAEYKQLKRIRDVTLGERPLVAEGEVERLRAEVERLRALGGVAE